MIKKFLYIHGPRVYLSSSPVDDENKIQQVFELSLPIETYWEVSKVLNGAEFLLSVPADAVAHAEYMDIRRKVLIMLAPHVARETDRDLVYKMTS